MPCRIRPTTPSDREAVAAVLRASYATLLKDVYAPDVLDSALAYLAQPNPRLLESGTYYIAERGAHEAAGCGGWSLEQPGDPDAPIDPACGHLRHFATHPDAVRRGVGRRLLETCVREAQAAGVERLECLSTRQAVPFYLALGLRVVGPVPCRLGPDVVLPGVAMALYLERR